MFNKVMFVFMILGFTVSFVNAQNSKVFFDNIIKNEDDGQKIPVELPHVEKEDVVWCKTVWRELILKEKMNLPLYYPTVPMDGRMSLIDLMMQGIEKSFKTAYEDDELTIPITFAEIKEKFGAVTDSITRRNSETGEPEKLAVTAELNTAEVKRLQVKELWYFSRRTSRLEVRVIALCPIREYAKDEMEGLQKRVLFWIDYGEFRDLFVKNRVFNFQNDAMRLSVDDVFLKRYFSSRIIKESNTYDNRSIQSYSAGMDAVLESDRIKKAMFEFEQDLWEY